MKEKNKKTNKSIDSDALNENGQNYLRNLGALTAILGAGAAGMAFTPKQVRVTKTSLDTKSQVIGSLSRVQKSATNSNTNSNSLTSLSAVSAKAGNFVSSQKHVVKTFAIKANDRNVSSAKEFADALNNPAVQNIYLTKNISLSNFGNTTKAQDLIIASSNNRNLTIQGNGYSINLDKHSISLKSASSSKVVRNITFKNAAIYSSSNHGVLYAIGQGTNNVILNNVKAVGQTIFNSSDYNDANTLTLQGATELHFAKSYTFAGHKFNVKDPSEQAKTRGVKVSSGISISDHAHVTVTNDHAVANDFKITGNDATHKAFFTVGNDASLEMNTKSQFNVMINGHHQNSFTVGHNTTVSMNALSDNVQLFDAAKTVTQDHQNQVDFAKDSIVNLTTKYGSNIRMDGKTAQTAKPHQNTINFNGTINFVKNSGIKTTKEHSDVKKTQANIEVEPNTVKGKKQAFNIINFRRGTTATLTAKNGMSNIGVQGGNNKYLLINIVSPKIVTLKTNGAPQYLSKPILRNDSQFDVNADLTDVEVTKRIKVRPKQPHMYSYVTRKSANMLSSTTNIKNGTV